MNTLLENGTIRESRFGADFAYTLADDELFLPGEYKVMRDRTGDLFLQCMKLRVNDKIQLYYMTQNQIPLSDLIPSLSPDQLLMVVADLFDDVVRVGRLEGVSCRSLDNRFSRIYIDRETYKTKLVYLPISKRLCENDDAYAAKLRADLADVIRLYPHYSCAKVNGLLVDLGNSDLSLEEICRRIRNNTVGGQLATAADPIQAPAAPAAVVMAQTVVKEQSVVTDRGVIKEQTAATVQTVVNAPASAPVPGVPAQPQAIPKFPGAQAVQSGVPAQPQRPNIPGAPVRPAMNAQPQRPAYPGAPVQPAANAQQRPNFPGAPAQPAANAQQRPNVPGAPAQPGMNVQQQRPNIPAAPAQPAAPAPKPVPTPVAKPAVQVAAKASARCRIVAVNTEEKAEVEITKDQFLIGKKPESVDGAVTFNKMISRVHCRIDRKDGQYTVMDLQSANGTYVNGVKLQPNVPFPLKDRDIVRLANSDFRFEIE